MAVNYQQKLSSSNEAKTIEIMLLKNLAFSTNVFQLLIYKSHKFSSMYKVLYYSY